MDRRTYRDLLRLAERRSRRADGAADLLQTALLPAIEKRRGDMTRSENRRWLCSVLRNPAALEARAAARRRQRERRFMVGRETTEAPPPQPAHDELVAHLPATLRTTALLVLTGHTKAEICRLLNLGDAAFRKRVSEIRRRRQEGGDAPSPEGGGPKGELPFGAMRKALLPRVGDRRVGLATRDPDGHLFVLRSRIGASRQRGMSGHRKRRRTGVRQDPDRHDLPPRQ